MPTVAQQRLAKFQRWLARSSSPQPSPIGNKMNGRGAYASIVPQRTDAPLAGIWEPEALPLAVAAELADGVGLPPPQLANPCYQPRMSDRLSHLIFLWQDGRELPPVALVGIHDAAQTLTEARSAAGVGDGLSDRLPTLYVPLYRLAPHDRRALAPLFPFVSTHPDPVECEIAQAARVPADRQPFRLEWRY